MAAKMDQPETIQVTLELTSSLEHLADVAPDNGRVDLRTSLRGYLDELVAGLGLPAAVALNINLSPEQWPPSRGPYQVTVNGQKCRLVSGLTLPATESELTRSVARAIVRNRELLVSAALAGRIQDQWAREDNQSPAANLPASEFHSLLLALVSRGFKIDAAAPLTTPVSESVGGNRGIAAIFEETIVARPPRIRLFLGESRAAASAPGENLTPPADPEEQLRVTAAKMVSDCFYEFGLILPEVELARDDSLHEDDFRVQLNDLILPPATGAGLDQFAVNQTAEELSRLELSGQRIIDSSTEKECVLLTANDELTKKCREANLPTATRADYVLLTLRAEIEKNAGGFLTTDVVALMQYSLRQFYPIIVDAAAPKFDLVTLTGILRGLIDEGLSIRDLRTILEGLLAVDGTTTIVPGKYIFFFSHASLLCPVDHDKKLSDLNVNDHILCVRIWLNRQISSRCLAGATSLPAYFISPEIEARLRNLEREPWSVEEQDRLQGAIVDAFSSHPAPTPPVLITTVDVRRTLRKLLEKEFPQLPVVCYEELSKYTNIQALAQITVN